MNTEKQETRYFKRISNDDVFRQTATACFWWCSPYWTRQANLLEDFTRFNQLTAEQAADIIGREAVFGKDETKKGGDEKCIVNTESSGQCVPFRDAEPKSLQPQASPAAEVTKAASSPQWIPVAKHLPDAGRAFWHHENYWHSADICDGITDVDEWFRFYKATHWMYAEGNYQIPPPPPKSETADEAFEKWWIGTKIALNAYERHGARIGWNAGVEWANKRKGEK